MRASWSSATRASSPSAARAAPGCICADDPNIQSLVGAETPAICFVGKASLRQVREILETTPEENLAMIADSVAYMRGLGKQVFFDAEHFFDGFAEHPEYALQVLRTAVRAGAEVAILCDTNGGTITPQLLQRGRGGAAEPACPSASTSTTMPASRSRTTLAAFEAGAVQIQGCINGYGERCGNANLITIIANLKLKLGVDCVSDAATGAAHRGLALHQRAGQPGARPAGAVRGPERLRAQGRLPRRGDREEPANRTSTSIRTIVGNGKRVLVSELSGQRNILAKLEEQGDHAAARRASTRAGCCSTSR